MVKKLWRYVKPWTGTLWTDGQTDLLYQYRASVCWHVIKTVPPTSEAFKENVLRAHFQVTVWKSAPETEPPSLDPTEYGWVPYVMKPQRLLHPHLTPTTLPSDVALAPPEVLELLRCGCSTDEPCHSQECGCNSGQVPCTFFCACRGGPNCRNPYKIDKERASEDDSDDCAEADCDIDWWWSKWTPQLLIYLVSWMSLGKQTQFR